MSSDVTPGQPTMRRGPVGIAATRLAAVEEVIGLLARDGVGVSQVVGSPGRGAPDEADSAVEAGRLLQAIRQLKSDADTRVIALLSAPLEPGAAEPVLAAAGGTGLLGRPTIACVLGANPRAVWRSGAIPAARFDEAAMRAAAWARGWDQALVSSKLQEQDEYLAAQADGLSAGVGSGRRRLRAVFDDPIFDHEARLMLAAVAAAARRPCPELNAVIVPAMLSTRAAGARWQAAVEDALADPAAAVVLLDLWLPPPGAPDRVGTLISSLGSSTSRVLVHVCGVDAARVAGEERRLATAGVTIAPANAGAARLAAMIGIRLLA